ncbi:trypsin-1-like [Choristoneura fumiferana]|uniref:trypsin-1-like n=1 Tax=Choristoneura fumiferana TaxID=7141 RepID=UPI003D1594FE
MKMIHKLLSITVLYLINNVASQGAGESCIQDGVPGLCTVLGQCQSVLGNPKSQWWKLHRCGFQGPEPIICCVPSATTTTQRPVATTPKLGSSTTEYIPPVFDYQPSLPVEEGCTEPIPGVTAAKTGRKAWDKCIEYKEELIYPCKQSVALSGSMNRVSNCRQNADGLIVGGKDASQNEFPHMVLLGFGQSSETAAWQCGGSLLSEKFILTAGHCTWARDLGPVTYAIVGSLRRSDKVDSSQVHRIQHIIKHPQYKAPSKYHDIALLETLLPVTLGASAVPVCLDIFGGNTSQAVATGWGATAWRGSDADILQKVTLTKFKEEECRKKFPRSRTMEHGFDADTQICYGDYTERVDTCQGDSGGPLTIQNAKVTCTYIIVGITSFGKSCGSPKDPGIYTKVSYYVPWIESIVWP